MIETLKKEVQLRAASAYLQHWGINHRLKPEGKEHWNSLINKMRKGEPVIASEAIGIVNGFEYHIAGLERLAEIAPDKGLLIIANHSNEGPVRGWGQVIVMQNAFKEATGREITWAQGNAASGSSEPVRGSVKTIRVNSGNGVGGARNVLQAMRTETVGLFAEGTQKRDLQKGLASAGKMVANAARHGIPIFAIATFFRDGKIYVSVDSLDPTEIKELEKIKNEGVDPYQRVIDYAMTAIASHLPTNRRGDYGEKAKTLFNPPTPSV